MRNTRIEIVELGDVKINEATVVAESNSVVALEIDFATKFNELVSNYGNKLRFAAKNCDCNRKRPMTEALFGKEILSESYKIDDFLPEYLMYTMMPKHLTYLFESWIANIEIENEQQTFQDG